MKKRSQKIYAFIDSQNVHLGIKHGHGWRLDFAKFRIYLEDKYRVVKAFLFIGNKPGNEKLYTTLQEAGYIVILKPTLEYKKKGKIYTKGNVDAELVLHAMIEYPNYDKAIIASSDGDFYCLLDYLAEKNKLLRLFIPNKKRHSALLRKFIKLTTYLGELKSKLAKKRRGITLRTKP